MLRSLILTGGYMKTLKIAMLSGIAALTIGVVGVLATPAQASAYSGTTGKGCTAYQYRRGNNSTCVGYIQQMLNGTNAIYGFYYGGASLAIDGSFGPMTETQTKRFQGMMSLKDVYKRQLLCYFPYFSSNHASLLTPILVGTLALVNIC